MRKTALAAGGFALVIALSACGGNKGGEASAPAAGGDSSGLFGNAQDLVQAASAKTSEKKTSKFTMDTAAMGQQMTMKGEGRYDGGNTAMSMTMNGPTGEMEMRFVDKTMYMKMPQGGDPAAAAMTGGKPWIKISAGGDDVFSKMLGGSFDKMAEQSDPSKTLEQVQKAGAVTKSEKTQLDGQEATHYSITLDMAKMADSAPGGLPKEATAGMTGTVPMELWLNNDQLPMQIEMDMSNVLKAAAEKAKKPEMANAGGKMTMKYTDWGGEVNVQAPPADQVGEFKMPEMPKMPQPTR